MREVNDLESWRAYADGERTRGQRVALVATMGALHAGHESLFRVAREHGDVVVATIFVNPRQFNDPADYERYPRTLDADRAIVARAGVDCLVVPSLADVWPGDLEALTTVSVGPLAERFEGADRPGHFDGVASVVAKILHLTGPCRAVFGEKDYQQLCVVRAMVRDLAFDVEVVAAPIVRDDDGLALSSRNARLSAEGRRRALALSRALAAARSRVRTVAAQRELLHGVLAEDGVEVAYADVVDADRLEPCRDGEVGERRALVAAVVEGVRLLDNSSIEVGE